MRNRLPTSRAIMLLAGFALAVLIAGPASSQQPVPADVGSALAYLSGEQQGDGSYTPLNPLATDYQTTARVAQALGSVLAFASELGAAQGFLASQVVGSVEERARRLIADSTSPDVAGLLLDQNSDGGFGSEAGFANNVLDTAFAAVALTGAGVPTGIVARDLVVPASGADTFTIDVPADGLTLDIVIEAITGTVDIRIGGGAPPTLGDPFFLIAAPAFIQLVPGGVVPLVPGETHFIEFRSAAGATVSFRVDYTAPSGGTAALTDALEYLQDARNQDGGWGFQPADDNSQLYYSYWAARALATGRVDVSAFALARELPGGGFADTGAANVFDTGLGLALLALAQQDPETTAPDSITFLETAQLPNGGFDDDPYRTAWAVDALLASRTPLAPVISSNGGAGAGVDFITDLSVVTISGFAPAGAAGVTVNVPGATIVFDAATGQYSITFTLSEGLNAVTVSASNAAGVSGPPVSIDVTLDSSLTGEDLVLSEGFNAIGLTLSPANPLDAMGLLELIGSDALEVQRLDSVAGLFDTLARDGMGGFTGPNFALGALDGVNVVTSASAAARITGSPSGTTTVDLALGTNTLTVPNPPAGLDAFALLGLIGDDTVVSALQRFDAVSGAFETAVYDGGVPAGANFPIETGVAYLVSMEQAVPGFVLPVALGVAITSPTDGATLTSTPVTVNGIVSGVPPITVTVNGIPATVGGGTFSASVPLVEGANVITADATDAVAGPVSDVINVTLQTIDYSIPAGGFVQDSRIISGSAAVMAQVVSISFSVIGIPPGLNYGLLGAFFLSATELQVDFQIDVAPGTTPGIYQFQVQNQLLDSGDVPVGPLVGDLFDFSIEVTP